MTHPNILNETVYYQAQSYFDSFVEGIQQAQLTIELESYIFSAGPLADRIVKELIQAALRGVSVRVLVDGAGIDETFHAYSVQLRHAGARVRIFHPLPWDLHYWPLAITPSEGLQKYWYLMASINKRNHRKTLCVDGKTIWLGSFNIAMQHLPEQVGGQNWRDTAAKVAIKNGPPLNKAFNRAWYRWRWHKLRKDKHTDHASPFIFNYSRKLRKHNHRNLIARIDRAESRIWITNAYFVPDSKSLKALILASQRGVEVRILIPGESDVAFIPWISSQFYSELLSAGARIFEYQARILHAKTLIIDDWATIGSSNFNRRSLFHDLEIDYIVQQQDSIKMLEHLFIEDIKQSTEQRTNKPSQRPLWQKLVGSVLLVLLGYWI